MDEKRTYGTMFGLASVSPRADRTVRIILRSGELVVHENVREAVLWHNWGVVLIEGEQGGRRIAYPADAITSIEAIIPKEEL